MARPAEACVSVWKVANHSAKLTDVCIDLRRAGLILQGNLQCASDSGGLAVYGSSVMYTDRFG